MLRRLERLLTNGFEAKAEVFGFQSCKQTLLQAGTEIVDPRALWNLELNCRHAPKAICPHFLAGGQSDERLWRTAIFLPVILVFGANLIRERETRIPVARTLSLLDAREIRHQRAVSPKRVHGHNAVYSKGIRVFDELRPGLWREVSQRNVISGLRPKIVRQPIVEQNFIISHVRWRIWRSGGCDHGIGR